MSGDSSARARDRNRRNIVKLVAGYAGVAVTVVALLVLVRLPLVVPLVVLAVFAALGAYVHHRGDQLLLRSLGATPADPHEHARFHNLVDGLCIAAGVEKPALKVIANGAANLCTVGRDARHATIVVTEGLLDALDRIELEGVLAHELVHIKNLDTRLATLACFVPFATGLLEAHRESMADLAAIEITRYPPGLIGGLEKMRERGTYLTAAPKRTWHLWIEPVSAESAQVRARTELSIEDRIAALREL